MRWGVIGVVAVLLVVGVVWYANYSEGTTQNQTTQTTEQKQYATIASQLADGSAVLLDVRTADEFASEHIKDAQNISLQAIEGGALPDVAKDTTLYIYCRSGNRSAQVATLLREAGYTNVVDLGGIRDVEARGATIVP